MRKPALLIQHDEHAEIGGVAGKKVFVIDNAGNQITNFGSISETRFNTNVIDDYTTTSVTYVGQEDSSGVWRIKKIDESGNYPVITWASVTNNPTLTSYTTAFAARVTATYADYGSAF